MRGHELDPGSRKLIKDRTEKLATSENGLCVAYKYCINVKFPKCHDYM